MKALIHAAIAASILVGPTVSFAQSVASAPVSHDSAKTFDVFVDQPTGYTFVKLPSGWKFVGAVSKDDAQHLPGTVLTSVLPAGTSQQASTSTIVRQ